MNMRNIANVIYISILITGFAFPQTFEYISPKENSTLVSLSTNIILRSSQYIDQSSLSPNEFNVIGSKSGIHTGTVKLSDDNKTILFFPNVKFDANEVVNVTVKPGIKTVSGSGFFQLDFQFTTTPLLHPINPETLLSDNKVDTYNSNKFQNLNQLNKSTATIALPVDFPLLKVDSLNNPWDGKIFIANKPAQFNSYGSYLIIADNNGNIIKYRKFDTPESNFRVLPNGELMTSERGRHLILDTTLAPIDTFKCGNGYTADSHDFVLLPNGHALLFGVDPEPMDMSKIIPGGDPNATVIGAVVQELDASKDVIFQWRTFDYIPITDSYSDLTQSTVAYGHANAICADNDGNILFSLRFCSNIIKINRETGNVMWILGGKENQFTFINEHPENAPTYFSNQHNVTALPDGDILLFDNGDDHQNSQGKPYSRGVEYKLDEQAMTATMVWEYDHGKTIYTRSGGSIQRLPNGNTLLGWSRPPGGGIYHPTMTEVNDTNIVMEMSFQAQDTLFSYRAFKYQWVSQQPEYSFFQIDPLQGNIYPNPVNPASDTLIGVYVKFDSLNAETYSEFHVKRYNYSTISPTFSTDAPLVYPYHINFSQDSNIHFYKGQVTVQLKFLPAVLDPANTLAYKINPANGNFEPIATSYDSSYVYNGQKNLGKVLMFNIDSTYFGDLLFGVPQKIDSAYTPVPFSPVDSAEANKYFAPVFRWGTPGIVDSYHLQISTDNQFINLIVDTSGYKSTEFYDTTFSRNYGDYFWRVQSTNSAGTSNWSKMMTLFLLQPFIAIYPDMGGTTFYTDTTYILRWRDNLTDKVNIQLLHSDTLYSSIGNSVNATSNAYSWTVASTITTDSNYKIRITSVNDSTLTSTSGPFTIVQSTTDIKGTNNIVKYFRLYQNYPNPFNPTTVINFEIPKPSLVTLKVYDILGREVATLVNEEKPAGRYNVTFDASKYSSGVYFYRITAGDFSQIKKMVLLK